jgi:hypothetical protein
MSIRLITGKQNNSKQSMTVVYISVIFIIVGED